MKENFRVWRRKLLAFLRANGGNVAMMFGLSIVPLTIAGGAGLDFARAMMVRSSMADALDAAALAVGTNPNISASAAQALAQQYVNANYTQNSSEYGTPVVGLPIINTTTDTVQITATDAMPTTLLSVGNLIPTLNISVSTTVNWGQSKLWVALVLDNTGSMTETDSSGTSKLTALKTAAGNLITTLQNASSTVGDVQMSVTPFAKLVNIGTGFVSSTAIDWTDWAAAPPGGAPASTVGPGSSCPWTTGSNGFRCVVSPSSSSTTNTIPSTGTYTGYICPSVVSTYTASGSMAGLGGHHYNGCYNSVYSPTTSSNTSTSSSQVCSVTGRSSGSQCTCSGYPQTTNSTSGNTTTVTTSTCSCASSGSGSRLNTTCTASNSAVATTTTPGYTHTWLINNHSTWGGCLEDRNQNGQNGATADYDTENTSPGTSSPISGFPAANDDNCPITAVTPLPSTWAASQWTTLTNQINAMTAQGSTNQTIGLALGWQTLSSGFGPFDPPTLPANTSEYIILVSDGLNTQDRWYGDGSDQSSQVDAREALACTNAKAAGITIYTIYVDLGGTQGSSAALQSCASDSTKYFDLTTSTAIITTFNAIAQQITNLRVSR